MIAALKFWAMKAIGEIIGGVLAVTVLIGLGLSVLYVCAFLDKRRK